MENGEAIRRSRWRILWILPILGLLVLSAVLLVGPIFQPEEPREEDWLEAARIVRKEWKEGDIVRLEPSWMTSGRVFFGDIDGGAPVPFRALDVHDQVDVGFLHRFQRIWWVTALNLPLPLPEGMTVLKTWPMKRLSMALVEVPSERLLWMLESRLEDVEFLRSNQGEPGKPCQHVAKGFRCGVKDASDPRIELREVAGGPMECLIVTPGPGSLPALLQMSHLPGPGELILTWGQTLEAARVKDGGQTRLTVMKDSSIVVEELIAHKDYELHELVLALPEEDSKVTLVVEADNPAKRELCIQATILKPLDSKE